LTSDDANGPHRVRYVPEIDGLRAVAVLSVIAYHLAPSALPGGFTGVDIFFVISGYVVSGSLSRDGQKTFPHFLSHFYSRRILRILPASVACLIATSLATILFVPQAWLSDAVAQTGRAAFVGLSNFALIRFDDGYFSPSAEFNPFTHTWSLAVEEQFYLLFPPVFYAWLRWRERKGVRGTLANALLPGLLVASLAYAVGATRSSPSSAFYLLPGRFWELACGAVLFQLHHRGRILALSTKAKNLGFAFGTALLTLALRLATSQGFPFPWALVPCIGTLALIAAVASQSAGRTTLATLLLGNPIVVGIGRLSYSLYLWHWPVFTLFRWTLGLEGAACIAGALGLTAVASAASYRYVEQPFRSSRPLKLQPRWRVVTAGLVAAASGYGLAVGAFSQQERLSLSVTRDAYLWHARPWPSPPATSPDRCPTRVEGRQIEGGSAQSFSRQPCDEAPATPHRLFVLGDSHAGAYATLLRKLTDEEGIEVYLYSAAGCSAASLVTPTAGMPGYCAGFLRSSTDDIKRRASPGDVVLLASLRLQRFGDQWALRAESSPSQDRVPDVRRARLHEAFDEAADLVTDLSQAKLRVILDAPKPLFKAPPFRCSDWFNAVNPICEPGLSVARNELLERRAEVMDALERLRIAHPQLLVWDPLPPLCPGDTCFAFDAGGPLFFDGDHLSAHGNRVLYPSLLSLLSDLWPSMSHASP